MTRVEAAMFARLLTNDKVPEGNIKFKDTKSKEWYENAISYMVNNGYMQGYPDGTFRPNDKITRA